MAYERRCVECGRLEIHGTGVIVDVAGSGVQCLFFCSDECRRRTDRRWTVYDNQRETELLRGKPLVCDHCQKPIPEQKTVLLLDDRCIFRFCSEACAEAKRAELLAARAKAEPR